MPRALGCVRLCVLALLTCSAVARRHKVADAAAAAQRLPGHDRDRLPGWRGEVHSVAASIAEKNAELHEFATSVNGGRYGTGGCDTPFSTASVAKANRKGPGSPGTAYPGEAVATFVPHAAGVNYKHMAMIETLPNGTLALAWQTSDAIEGTKQRLVFTTAPYTQEARAVKFEPSKDVPVGSKDGAVWGPVLFVDPRHEAKLWLFYSESRVTSCGSRVPGMDFAPGGDIKVVSLDLSTGGWDAHPRTILSQDYSDGIPKVTANKPAVLRSGDWVLPYWNERAMLDKDKPECDVLQGSEGAGVIISKDQGQTWVPSQTIVGKNTWLIENAVVELSTANHLLMVFRSKAQFVYSSYSHDGGLTWEEAKAIPGIPNPNSKIDLLRVEPSGALALAFNDQNKRSERSNGCSRCRTHLKIAMSTDEGKSWVRVRDIEDTVDKSMRIHYPTLTQRGCELLIAYSRFYKLEPSSDEGALGQGIYVGRVPLITP